MVWVFYILHVVEGEVGGKPSKERKKAAAPERGGGEGEAVGAGRSAAEELGQDLIGVLHDGVILQAGHGAQGEGHGHAAELGVVGEEDGEVGGDYEVVGVEGAVLVGRGDALGLSPANGLGELNECVFQCNSLI